MKVFWTYTAEKNYLKNLDYLKKNWGKKSVLNFIEKINQTISVIVLNPDIGIFEKKLGFRRFLVVKHIYLFYNVEDDCIYIHNVWNNKRKPFF